jgi:hypothetical protein
MIVLDSVSGPGRDDGRNRWMELLIGHDIYETDAAIIYALRCSLLHGYGFPRSAESDGSALSDSARHEVPPACMN